MFYEPVRQRSELRDSVSTRAVPTCICILMHCLFSYPNHRHHD